MAFFETEPPEVLSEAPLAQAIYVAPVTKRHLGLVGHEVPTHIITTKKRLLDV